MIDVAIIGAGKAGVTVLGRKKLKVLREISSFFLPQIFDDIFDLCDSSEQTSQNYENQSF